MDRFIEAYPATADDDLMLCLDQGTAYQRDMAHRVTVPYFEKCAGYEGKDIAQKINLGRIDLVNRHLGGNTHPVLDVGVGSGEFIKRRPNTFGYDVDPQARAWLEAEGWWRDDLSAFSAFTFWDVIEHVENPDDYFRHMPAGSFLFTCLPIFADLKLIRASRHYRPGEHLYYWTQAGFVEWVGCHGFRLLESSDVETRAGRDSIMSFAFQREAA